tara:strand:- start:1005 stop:2108 length:1104 start_codon:yes stop_codon:yes gene_type:complete
MKTAIITTTINYPSLLIDYAKDCKNIKKKIDIAFIVAGDLKTPKNTKLLCNQIEKKYKVKTLYLDPKTQSRYLKKFKELKNYLSWNSVQRRNVAFLKALELGYEIIITIDDDNFIKTRNFVKKHLEAFIKSRNTIINSSTNWFNVCELLNEKNNNIFYHRGFPVSKRGLKSKINYIKCRKKKIGINAGLWLGDPDVDAVTRLAGKITSTSYKFKKNFLLSKTTNSPFNSQNTAINYKLAPCYFLSSDVGRMDDIYASYITKKVCNHMDYYVSYGEPIVVQNRNDHNIWKDLDLERPYHENLEIFLDVLDKIKVPKKINTVLKTTKHILKRMLIQINKSNNNKIKKSLKKFIKSYLIWLKTIDRLKMF